MKCETCPIRDQCPAYERAYQDNVNNYHSPIIVRVSDYDEPSCPLLTLIKTLEGKE